MTGPRVAVATSGGLDSTALLHCTVAQARPLGVEVVALHVHHGLMAEADSWLDQVRRQARRWGAGFAVTRLAGRPARGESVEAWARDHRYAALANMAREQGCPVVMLAHHRRDQAETWLLQALRGAGDAGLSGMARSDRRDGLTWERPWLDMGREAIEAYARRHRLRWVDDTSNRELRFARSRLRVSVWPALQRAFPEAEVTLARAAGLAQASSALAQEVAAEDLARLGATGPLQVTAWRRLSEVRRTHALRAWLAAACGGPAPFTLVERLSRELMQGEQPAASWPSPAGVLRLYRGQLTSQVDATPVLSTPAPRNADLSRPQTLSLPEWQGSLVISRCKAGGVAPEVLRTVRIHARQGGEQFQAAPGSTARSLKKQFQSQAVPSWARTGPLVSLPSGPLLFVPQLGLDARHWARPGRPQLLLQWLPDAAKPTGQGQPPG